MSEKWSKDVKETSTSDLLPEGLFKRSPKEIAEGLKKAVEESKREMKSKYDSAMSMLDFYINRAGKNLTPEEKDRLEKAKVELKKLFGKENS